MFQGHVVLEMWTPPDCFYETHDRQSLSSEINMKWRKCKSFVTRKIHYFELRIFASSLYIYHLTRSFTGSSRALNLLLIFQLVPLFS